MQVKPNLRVDLDQLDRQVLEGYPPDLSADADIEMAAGTVDQNQRDHHIIRGPLLAIWLMGPWWACKWPLVIALAEGMV